MKHKHCTTLFEHYRQEIKRIAWRLQYKEKVKRKKEVVGDDDFSFKTSNFAPTVESEIFLFQLINTLPSETGRNVIKGIFIEGKTEKELAEELKMSQQGVNKWKRNMLKQLYQTMN